MCSPGPACVLPPWCTSSLEANRESGTCAEVVVLDDLQGYVPTPRSDFIYPPMIEKSKTILSWSKVSCPSTPLSVRHSLSISVYRYPRGCRDFATLPFLSLLRSSLSSHDRCPSPRPKLFQCSQYSFIGSERIIKWLLGTIYWHNGNVLSHSCFTTSSDIIVQ